MNSCHFSGWLPREADVRPTKGGAPVMFFQVVVKSPAGEDEFLSFRCDDAAIIETQRALMTRGRRVTVARCAVDRLWHPMTGVSGAVLAFRVFELEIADRTNPVEPEAKAKEEQAA